MHPPPPTFQDPFPVASRNAPLSIQLTHDLYLPQVPWPLSEIVITTSSFVLIYIDGGFLLIWRIDVRVSPFSFPRACSRPDLMVLLFF